jgi:stress-induced morphogen
MRRLSCFAAVGVHHVACFMEEAIAAKIQAALTPTSLSVTCTDPSTGKFAVVVISEAFRGKSLLARHRAVNSAVGMNDPEVQHHIHALEIDARAPDEA